MGGCASKQKQNEFDFNCAYKNVVVLLINELPAPKLVLELPSLDSSFSKLRKRFAAFPVINNPYGDSYDYGNILLTRILNNHRGTNCCEIDSLHFSPLCELCPTLHSGNLLFCRNSAFDDVEVLSVREGSFVVSVPAGCGVASASAITSYENLAYNYYDKFYCENNFITVDVLPDSKHSLPSTPPSSKPHDEKGVTEQERCIHLVHNIEKDNPLPKMTTVCNFITEHLDNETEHRKVVNTVTEYNCNDDREHFTDEIGVNANGYLHLETCNKLVLPSFADSSLDQERKLVAAHIQCIQSEDTPFVESKDSQCFQYRDTQYIENRDTSCHHVDNTQYAENTDTLCQQDDDTQYAENTGTPCQQVDDTQYAENTGTPCQKVDDTQYAENTGTPCQQVDDTQYAENTGTPCQQVDDTQYAENTETFCRHSANISFAANRHAYGLPDRDTKYKENEVNDTFCLQNRDTHFVEDKDTCIIVQHTQHAEDKDTFALRNEDKQYVESKDTRCTQGEDTLTYVMNKDAFVENTHILCIHNEDTELFLVKIRDTQFISSKEQTASRFESNPEIKEQTASRLETNPETVLINLHNNDVKIIPKLHTDLKIKDGIQMSSLQSKSVKEMQDASGKLDPEMSTPFYFALCLIPGSRDVLFTVNMLSVPQTQHSRTQINVVHAGLESEMRRLATFFSFQPPPSVFVIRLANNGFFYPGSDKSDAVECAFCSVTVPVSKFLGRLVSEVHKESSPSCLMVLGIATRNIPITMLAQCSGNQFVHQYGSNLYQGASSLLPTDSGPGNSQQHNGSSSAHSFQKAAVDLVINVEPGILPTTVKGFGEPSFQAEVLHAGLSEAGSKSAERTVPDSRPSLQQPLTDLNSRSNTKHSPTPTVSVYQSDKHQPQTTLAAVTTSNSESQEHANTNTNISGNGDGDGRRVVTYEQLGIYTQRPKRQDMAVTTVRINTFSPGWPHSKIHPPVEMASAGFFYTGNADLVRCFHCKGGLKTWDASENPWVEHGRWFPTCQFVRLNKGEKFVEAVKSLVTSDNQKITLFAVERKVKELEDAEKGQRAMLTLPSNSEGAQREPAASAEHLSGLDFASLKNGTFVDDEDMLREISRRLEEENQEMKSYTMCKICQTEKVNVLLLPCGHLIACAQCAPALRNCAICRQPVKGTVRVHLDEEKT